MTLESSFPHQRKIDLGKGSRVAVRESLFANAFLPSFEVREGASLEFDAMTPVGACTSTSIHGGGSVTVRNTRWPGEFMIFPGAKVSMEDTTMPLLWVTLGDNAKGRVSFPDGKRIDDWTLDPAMGIALSLRRCSEVNWGMISAPGSDVTVENTRFATAGITLWGEVKLEGIRNGDAATGGRLHLPDRKIALSNTTVDVWNLYAGPGSTVTLKGCRVGECWSMGDADLTLADSECDGKGGYVTALDTSSFRLVNCKLDSEVIAQDGATMTLERCTVSRTVSASGRATLTLSGSKIPGAVQRIGDATVEEK